MRSGIGSVDGRPIAGSSPGSRITLIRDELTEGLVGQYVEIYHFADGEVDVRWKGRSLPYAVFDKEQRVSQALKAAAFGGPLRGVGP